ncbi:MAG: histidine phosphatase family protein [Dehalococcoidia bacterium]|nr:histidine phosphatase family protein [Dehalococcoidia bacterium]
MTQFILVRHGQTEWNRVERFRGRADIELNQTGLEQARAAAERLARSGASAVYSSPLKRALVTARTIAEPLGLSARSEPALLDMDYGEWQGLTIEDVARQDALYATWITSPHLVKFPGGEGLEELRSRVMRCLDSLVQTHRDQTVILVSHQVVCKTVVCALLGLDNSHFWQVTQDVCAVNMFEMSEAGILV